MAEQAPFDPSAYGHNIAGDYDETTGRLEPAAEVAVLSELAGDEPILEFGIGTGRLALPLIELGHRVAGIDGSAEMAEKLRAKPGGAGIRVEVGDFSETQVEGQFGLVVLAMNTIYALPSQEAQVRCFRNAARHLRAGGLFVADAWIPDPGAFRDGRALRIVDLADGEVVIEVAQIHPATQQMTTNKVFLKAGSVKVFPANHRYAWPAELDLMATLAGFALKYRWQDWTKSPYTDTSRAHVSVWEKLGD